MGVLHSILVEKQCYILFIIIWRKWIFRLKNRNIMEQQNTGQKILDPFERAKLGFKVFNLPFDEAEEVIDDYVSQGNYDPASVELFKDQLDTQRHIQEKGFELLSTSAQIARQVVSSIIKNWPKPPEETPSNT